MGVGKLVKSKQLLGAAVAAVLLTVIFVPFQQANAFTVTVDLPDATGVTNEITASIDGEPFEIVIDVAAGELISVDAVTLILDNGESSVKSTVFGSNGTRSSGDANLVINNEIVISALADGGYAYGFGAVSDGITGFAGYSYSFTYSNAFIGGNTGGANNPGVTDFVTGLLGPGEITISGTLRTADLADGTHTLDVLINTGAGVNPDEITIDPAFEFDVVEDDSVVVHEEPIGFRVTGADIVTSNSNGDPIEIELRFSKPTGDSGNAVVVVQDVDDFISANSEAELEAQGFELDGGDTLVFNTDDDDTTFIAVGFIMDIDLSALSLEDGTEVTLSMTYDDSDLSGSEENDVRLMHQLDTLDEWEALTNDSPINGGDEVDTDANIVYGTTDDFSLFGPAVESQPDDDDDDDGSSGGGGGGGGSRTVTITWPTTPTLPADHFLNFPLDRILVASSAFVNAGGVSINSVVVNQQVSIAGEFTNQQPTEQPYAFIVQVTDEAGFVTDVAWQQGTLQSGSTADVSTLWTPKTEGTFTVKIFVWNGVTSPEPLSEVTVKNISVS